MALKTTIPDISFQVVRLFRRNGLACTALVIGAIPAAFRMQWVISTGPMIGVLILLSAVAMVWGLNRLRLSAKQSADRGEIMEGSYGVRATV